MKIVGELWFCTDCTVAAVNDDYSGFSSDAQVRATSEGLGRVGWVSANFDEGEGEREFSSAPCDCCRSHLAGSRHRFAKLSDD